MLSQKQRIFLAIKQKQEGGINNSSGSIINNKPIDYNKALVSYPQMQKVHNQPNTVEQMPAQASLENPSMKLHRLKKIFSRGI